MDERTEAIEKLTSLRKHIIERDRILKKTQQLRQQKDDAIKTKHEPVQFYEMSTCHEEILKDEILDRKQKEAESKHSSIRVIFFLLGLALFVYSIFFLKGLSVSKFVTDSDYRSVFWIAHCLLSVLLSVLVFGNAPNKDSK